jgi:hypothetical protein
MGTTIETIEIEVRVLTENMFGEMNEHFLTLPTDDEAEIQNVVFETFGELEYEIVNVNTFLNSETC